MLAAVCGFGFNAYIDCTSVEFVHPEPVYLAVSVAALDAVVRLVERLVPAARVNRFYQEGEIVPAERKMLEITGPMSPRPAVAVASRSRKSS